MPDLNFMPRGRIIRAQVPLPETADGRGEGKNRYWLVLTPTGENVAGSPLGCIGISTDFSTNDFVMPHLYPGIDHDITTKLPERCAAICDWFPYIEWRHITTENFGYLQQTDVVRLEDHFEKLGIWPFEGK